MSEYIRTPEQRSAWISRLEELIQDIERIQLKARPLREGNREVALVLTKLDEARLWLGEAVMTA